MGKIYLKYSPSNQPKRVVNKKYIAYIMFSLGAFILLQAIVPILRFQIFNGAFRPILSPISGQQVLGDSTTDYTQLSNWFQSPSGEKISQGVLDAPIQKTYKLTIPKLKIEDAVVTIGSQDLAHSLIQYQDTALPGQLGGPVIFGHSVLPQFFNPKNYMTIFSTMYKLKAGDEIFIDYDSIKYRYKIDDIYETEASDLSVLEQRFDGKYLTVVTCHPPGTYLRRLVVKASIVDY